MVPAGRPPEPVPEAMAAEIIEWISQGKTLREFCRQPGKPSRRSVDEWRLKDPTFAARVARARDCGFDQIADECMAISDTTEEGITLEEVEDGKTTTKRGDMLGHRKLRVETRLKLLACWDPRRYGVKQQQQEDKTGDAARRMRRLFDEALDATDGDVAADLTPPADEEAEESDA